MVPPTPPGVGPGSYETVSKWQSGGAKSAFASQVRHSARRGHSAEIRRWTATPTPGPGAYNVVQQPAYTRPATSMASRPATALTVRQQANELLGVRDVAQSSPSGRPVLGHTAILWMRKQTPPSIPSPMNAFGYEEDEEGVLQFQKPAPEPPHPTLKLPYQGVGPGAYNPKSGAILRSPVSISFPRANERTMTPTASMTWTAPGSHWGESCNPMRMDAPSSSTFAEPYAMVGKHPCKLFWQTACMPQGQLRDMQRRPGESGTTGWGDRREVVQFPGPGAHNPPPGMGNVRPVRTFPSQHRFLSAQLRRIREVHALTHSRSSSLSRSGSPTNRRVSMDPEAVHSVSRRAT
ncbi:hypothetical protein AB1Y20_006826 [Prymnesium parvum]|uniref:Uncharacterized protein n=1 Tax=Prymnesium parvum TaxID=97485 RepID=A0AB34IYS3_PRYPA